MGVRFGITKADAKNGVPTGWGCNRRDMLLRVRFGIIQADAYPTIYPLFGSLQPMRQRE